MSCHRRAYAPISRSLRSDTSGGCLVTAASSEFRVMPGLVRERLIQIRETYRYYLSELMKAALNESKSKEVVEPGDAVHRVLANEAAANVALFLGDAETFRWARGSTRRLIDGIAKPSS